MVHVVFYKGKPELNNPLGQVWHDVRSHQRQLREAQDQIEKDKA